MTGEKGTLEGVVGAVRARFGPAIEEVRLPRPGEAHLRVRMDDLRTVGEALAADWGGRPASVFAEDERPAAGCFVVSYIFAMGPGRGYIVLQTPVPAGRPAFPSLAAVLPAVNWQEREIQDWMGLAAAGHPNPRRVALHDNWPAVHPLRKDFDLRTVLPPFEGERHRYRRVEGEGVLHVPVGPVHAGVIEPGHFLFSVAGEPVLYLQIRLFYTHKGTEKLFETLPVAHGVFLAESVSGDSSVSHATAFCQALEQAAEVEVPPRGRYLRTILLELERLYNHVADIGAIATDVGFVIANAHALRIKEAVLRLNERLVGNRLGRGAVCPGGVRRDWDGSRLDVLDAAVRRLGPELDALMALIRSSQTTLDRLEGTGVLKPEVARDLGVVGVAGRASGADLDVRRDHPYAAYADLRFRVPTYTAGDVLHRLLVRADEARESLDLLRQARAALPGGPVAVPLGTLPEGRCGLGAVEGWRGEILHWVRTGPGGTLARCRIKDPSLNNWPALVEAVEGNIIPDFPVINKSFNLSYSGTDR